MTSTATTPLEVLDDPRDVLAYARACQVESDRAQAHQFIAAATWAEQHPPESIHEAAFWIGGGETGLPLAGQGAPLVAEFCIAEFSAAIGKSTDSGKLLIAHALELKYRLPRTWDRVQSGQLPAWRARRVAEATLALSPEAAAYVDIQVAPFAHKIGMAALDRLVQEAIDRFMPDLAKEKAEKSADGRHVKFHHDQVSFCGTTRIEGELDLADALDLDAALTAEAEQLALAGSMEPLDVRRALAVGERSPGTSSSSTWPPRKTSKWTGPPLGEQRGTSAQKRPPGQAVRPDRSSSTSTSPKTPCVANPATTSPASTTRAPASPRTR
jgi:hypothetical protein